VHPLLQQTPFRNPQTGAFDKDMVNKLLVEYDKILPQYGFASNKGYGSAEHIKALQEVGPSPIHRASFIKNFV